MSSDALPAGNVLTSSQRPRKAMGESSACKCGAGDREEAVEGGLTGMVA